MSDSAPIDGARSTIDREIRIKLAKRKVRVSAPSPASARAPKQKAPAKKQTSKRSTASPGRA